MVPSSGWTVLRTPDEAFHNLVDYPFSPHYIEDLEGYEGIRIHYVDEGEGHVFLCIHGEPSWSFLYRKMIRVFTQAGYRCVCPDLIGFGKSDKVKEDQAYTVDFHRTMLIRFIRRLQLSHVTLVVQDWGGVLGLTLPLEMNELVSRAIVMNTTFAVGTVPSEGFLQWKALAEQSPDLNVGQVFKQTCRAVSEEEIRAYEAPFPSVDYKAGVRAFPGLVPLDQGDPFAEVSRKALEWWRTFGGPVFVAAGVDDFVFPESLMQKLRSVFPNPSGLLRVEEGHFVQEKGDLVAHAALLFFAKQPSSSL